jgi:glycosyltransferase involved in cell wall biosynthesis
MACGTPVVAFRCGSVPEVVDDGVTGFSVDDLDAATSAAARALELDRRTCRETFERRFSVGRMASDYLELYAELIERARRSGSARFSSEVAA